MVDLSVWEQAARDADILSVAAGALAVGIAESLNARGGDVRRRLAQAGRDAITREAGTRRTAMPH